MNFDSASMERGEFCHDRYMGLLLVDYTQRPGAQPNRMRKRYIQALYLSAGFGDWSFSRINSCSGRR